MHGAVANVMVPVHTVSSLVVFLNNTVAYAADKPRVSCNDRHMPLFVTAHLCNTMFSSCKCDATICCQAAYLLYLQVL